MDKWALVVQGGGTRAAYAGGALEVLLKRRLYASLAIGTSAGALLTADYTSRDEGRNYKILTGAMKDPSFARLGYFFSKKANFFNFEWLFKELPLSLPFDLPTFLNSSTDFYCCTTSLETGKACYFNKKEKFFFDALAASCSMPLYTRKPVMVNGHPYLDGGVVARIPYEKAVEEGYSKIVVIATRERGFLYPNDGKEVTGEATLLSRFKDYPLFMEANRKSKCDFNAQFVKLQELADKGDIFLLAPSVTPSLGHASRSVKKIQELYALGEKDMENSYVSLINYLGTSLNETIIKKHE
jgi:predicted patatin/cPLA2 family phospholipase